MFHKYRIVLFLIVFMMFSPFFITGHPYVNRSLANVEEDVSIETIIDNNTVFPNEIGGMYMTFGDVTNDGSTDLVVSKGYEGIGDGAKIAVFQNPGGVWDNGTLLEGPSLDNAYHLLVAPIRNDGLNWLVYSEHIAGNNGEWLRGHRYIGTELVENLDIHERDGWPGSMGPNVADLNRDGDLEIWFVQAFGAPVLHLHRAVWDSSTNSYPSVIIKDVDVSSDYVINPEVGDFLADGIESVIWLVHSKQLDLVTYTPGQGTYDHTSRPIFTPSLDMSAYDSGELNGLPGTDIVAIAWTGSSYMLYIISGGSFDVTEIPIEATEEIRTVRIGDLDGNGIGEVYAADTAGSIYSYSTTTAWYQVGSQPDVSWWDGESVRWQGNSSDNVLFVGKINSTMIRVVSLSRPSHFCSAISEIPRVECDALVALYNSTNGVDWTDNTNWLATITPSDWYGVTIESGHVTQVNLPSNQLSGQISPELGNLTNLKILNLSGNQIVGSIPSELGNLTSLVALRMDQNLLSGDVPASLISLVHLYDPGQAWDGGDGLDLDYNALNVPANYPDPSVPLQVFLSQKDPDWHTLQAFEQVVNSEGGVITSLDGTIEFVIPDETIDTDTTFAYIPQPETAYDTGVLSFASLSFQLTAEDELGTPITFFDPPLTVTLYYSDTDLGSNPEDSLALYYWDVGSSAWVDAVTTCPDGVYTRDLDGNILSLSLCHLSEFAVLGEPCRTFLPLLRVTR